MGGIVGGFATSHILFEPDGVEQKARRVFDGMLEIGRRLRALRPDVLVIATSDHLNNFNLALQVPLVVGIRDDYQPLGDMGIPTTLFPGHREFAESFVRAATAGGFDLARAEELQPDHGLALPNLIVNRGYRIPVVPVYLNIGFDPPPSPARAWALGAALKSFVESARPQQERIVVLGTGGLSHWLRVPGEGRVNETFDRDVIAKLTSGHGEELAALSVQDVEAQAGNGGLEIASWLFVAGAMPGRRGECIYYEAMPEWITGMGGIALGPG